MAVRSGICVIVRGMATVKAILSTGRGKVGAGLLASGVFFGHTLDLYHKGETLYKWIKELPAVMASVQGALQYWYIVDPILIVSGMGLIWWSNREVKIKPEKPALQVNRDHYRKIYRVTVEELDASTVKVKEPR